jgi:16S rRNA G966 N2-methylase RsmD
VARAPTFDLAAELASRGFTPARRDAPGLVELIVEGVEPTARRAARALAELRDGGRMAIDARFETADEGAKARLVAALGLLARGGDEEAAKLVIAGLRDTATRVRRTAALALGKLGGQAALAALVARWDASDVTQDERRALTEALGKIGGAAALTRLRALTPGDDVELSRRRDRALLMADRSAKRDPESSIATDVAPPTPLAVRLACRQGLAPLLVEELKSIGMTPRSTSGSHAEVRLEAPWSTLFASRLWVTASIEIPLPPPSSSAPDALATSVTRAIASDSTRALFAAWTRGPVRWRLGFARGHRRAVVWRVARDVTAAAPELVNDPTAATWEVLVDDEAKSLELVPKRIEDPRFAWRVAEVPAASHPTVAAALAWVADVRPEDRVWDPFCGSGAELIERAHRGRYRSLLGTDLDVTALAAARENLDAAGFAAELTLADARTHDAGPVDLVITNPPLGRRVRLDAAALLVESLPHWARQLAPRGRLVWITPAPRKTTPIAESLKLRRVRSLAVDLGGVRGQLERWDAP